MAATIAEQAHTSAPGDIGQDNWSASLAAIENAQYLSLTTFRRSGDPVMTPVWFARVGQALYVITDDDTGKVKRIGRNPTVRLAPCTVRGKPIGATVDAVAHVRPLNEARHGMRALYAKYGWLFGAFELVHRVQRKTPVLLEIVPPDISAAVAVQKGDLESAYEPTTLSSRITTPAGVVSHQSAWDAEGRNAPGDPLPITE